MCSVIIMFTFVYITICCHNHTSPSHSIKCDVVGPVAVANPNMNASIASNVLQFTYCLKPSQNGSGGSRVVHRTACPSMWIKWLDYHAGHQEKSADVAPEVNL